VRAGASALLAALRRGERRALARAVTLVESTRPAAAAAPRLFTAGPEYVQSLHRGLSVIRCFYSEHAAMTLSQIATRAALARAVARRLLLTLERAQVLSLQQREIVIERLLALDEDEPDTEQLKWVVLMVLSSQPGQQLAVERLGGLVTEGRINAPH